jgi:hypothetical protein
VYRIALDTEVRIGDLPRQISSFFEIVPWEELTQSLNSLNQRANRHPIERLHIDAEFALEIAIKSFVDFVRSPTFSIPRFRKDLRSNLRAATFVIGVGRFAESLPLVERERFSQRILGDLNAQRSLKPIELEIDTALSLLRAGLTPYLSDIEGRGGFDFLVPLKSGDIEVECKEFNPDKGKKIHRKHVAQLGRLLAKYVSGRGVPEGRQAGIFSLEVPSRLRGAANELQALASGVVRAAAERRDQHCGEHGTIRFFELSHRHDEVVTVVRTENLQAVAEFTSKATGIDNSYVIANHSVKKGAFIFSVSSAQPDDLRAAYYDEIARATSQFSGNRPGFVFCRLSGVESHEIRELHRLQHFKRANLLQHVVTDTFRNKKPNPAGIVFVPAPTFSVSGDRTYGTALSSYTFMRDEVEPCTRELSQHMNGHVN